MRDKANIEVKCPHCGREVMLQRHPERTWRMYAVCPCTSKPFLECDASVSISVDPLATKLLEDVDGVGREVAMAMFHAGIRTLADADQASDGTLLSIAGIGPVTLRTIREHIQEMRRGWEI